MRKVLDATIAVHTEAQTVRQRNYWVIYVGKQGGAESDYLERGRPKGIRVFRYTPGENLANILSIIEGDVVVFATKWRTAGGRQICAGGNWSCSHLEIFEATSGTGAISRTQHSRSQVGAGFLRRKTCTTSDSATLPRGSCSLQWTVSLESSTKGIYLIPAKLLVD